MATLAGPRQHGAIMKCGEITGVATTDSTAILLCR